MMRILMLCLFVALFLAIPFAPAQADDQEDFEEWLVDMKARAINEGIPPDVVSAGLDGLLLDERVVELDQKQPEGKLTLTEYLEKTINARRIRIGKAMLEQYRSELSAVSRRYGVQPEFIVALWGIESDYGAHRGKFSVVRSLATLGFEGRRRELFSNQLIAALRIVANEKINPAELSGSWAGAMGNCQFMPTTYLKYAADGDGDGHRDIWNSVPDTFASIANYLSAIGWKDDYSWGTPVTTPDDFSEDDADIKTSKPRREWEALGFVIPPGARVGGPETPLSAIYAGEPEEGAFLITANYKAILEWNRSRYFATAVSTLADAIGEKK